MHAFLDLEATVNQESEDSDKEYEAVDRDERDAFIDSSAVGDLQAFQQAFNHATDDDEFDIYIDNLLSRALQEQTQSTSREIQRRDIPSVADRYPGADEYPIWRVECRIGTEEFCVASLYRTACERHMIRSAFTTGATRGYVYIECCMNSALSDLLRITPGIVITKHGIQMKIIETQDYVRTLTMKGSPGLFSLHTWVRISKGLYKGDEGIVCTIEEWGMAVLLVPRLNSPPESSKRKATKERPMPRLFDDDQRNTMKGLSIKRVSENTFFLGDMTIEHGLLLKNFDYGSVRKDVTNMSYNLFCEFMRSRHSLLKEVPLIRPREWHIDVKDEIIDMLDGSRGFVEDTLPSYVEADIEHEGTRSIPWARVRKAMKIGNEVTVMSGIHTGMTGWIVRVGEDVATVAISPSGGAWSGQNEVEHADIPLNVLKNDSLPARLDDIRLLSSPRKQPAINRHPWIGIEVVITQSHHPRKGETGVIIDVLPPQKDGSCQRIIQKLTRYNPNAPYSLVTINADAVITTVGNQTLYKVNSKNRSSYVFTAQQDEHSRVKNAERSGTPMPTDVSSTPAWNAVYDDYPILEETTQSTTRDQELDNDVLPQPMKHVLLNPALSGKAVKVTINDANGKPKDAIVTLHSTNGECSIRTIHYHTSVRVAEETVTPKHPSPTHNNGLVVIIKGEHVGKYGRRLYHSKKGGQVFMILEVIMVQDGQKDSVTGLILELAPDELCVADESPKQKKLNADVMKDSRQRYREQMKAQGR